MPACSWTLLCGVRAALPCWLAQATHVCLPFAPCAAPSPLTIPPASLAAAHRPPARTACWALREWRGGVAGWVNCPGSNTHSPPEQQRQRRLLDAFLTHALLPAHSRRVQAVRAAACQALCGRPHAGPPCLRFQRLSRASEGRRLAARVGHAQAMRRPCQALAPTPLCTSCGAAISGSPTSTSAFPTSLSFKIYRYLWHHLMVETGCHLCKPNLASTANPICRLLSSHISGCRKRQGPRPGLVCHPGPWECTTQTRPFFIVTQIHPGSPLHGLFIAFILSLCIPGCRAPPSLRAANACQQRFIVTSCSSPATLPTSSCAVWPGPSCKRQQMACWLCEWWRAAAGAAAGGRAKGAEHRLLIGSVFHGS